MQLQSAHEYVQMSEGEPFDNGRTVILEALPQAPQGKTDVVATVLVSAPLGGQPFAAPVNINLLRRGFELEIS